MIRIITLLEAPVPYKMDIRILSIATLLVLLSYTEAQNGQGCIRNCFLKRGMFHVCGSCTKFAKCHGIIGGSLHDCPQGTLFDSNVKSCVANSATCHDPALTSTVSQKPYVSFCECNGDPHCLQFDGLWVHFQGSCTYTMVRDKCTNGVPSSDPTFHVTTNNVKNRPHDNVAWVREIQVDLPTRGVKINVFRNRRVTINGEQMFGSRNNPHDEVEVVVTPRTVYIRIKDSVEITFDGVSTVRVRIPEDLKTGLCGICGNANDNSNDDWVVGPSTLCMNSWPGATAGSLTNDLNEFGYSWTHAIDEEESCVRECPVPPPPPGCTTVSTQKANEHCDILRNPTGPFAACINAMSDGKKAMFFDNCVYDSCSLELFDEVVCLHALEMSTYCRTEHEKEVSFRTSSFCPLECGAGMVYKACEKPCLPTCEDPSICENDDTPDGECEEGCFCEEGKVYNGVDACTDKSSCGCYVDEKEAFVPDGTEFLSDDCGLTCTCSGSELNCVAEGCDLNEVCSIQEGVRGCHCLSPAQLIDGECLSAKEICNQPKKPGTGSEKVRRFFYNPKKRKCGKFNFKGSNGNANNFESKEECEAFCDIFETPEKCKLPPDTGSGKKSKKVFYYDMSTTSCKTMNYLGQGGNDNRFNKKKDCERQCKP